MRGTRPRSGLALAHAHSTLLWDVKVLLIPVCRLIECDDDPVVVDSIDYPLEVRARRRAAVPSLLLLLSLLTFTRRPAATLGSPRPGVGCLADQDLARIAVPEGVAGEGALHVVLELDQGLPSESERDVGYP